MTLTQVHNIMAHTFAYFALIVALWALLHLIQGKQFGSEFWGAVVIGEVLIVVQCILGIVMLFMGLLPPRWVHYMYGAITLITWPALFAFTRGENRQQEVVTWIIISGILFGIALRAIGTGISPL